MKDEIHKFAVPLNSRSFMIATGLVVDRPQELINVVTGFFPSKGCEGTFNYSICSFQAAVGEYAATITANILTLDEPSNPNIVRVSDNVPQNRTRNGIAGSTLGGVVFLMHQQWDAIVSTTKIAGIETSTGKGDAADLFLKERNTYCPSYKDPLDQVRGSMNKLMV